MTITKVGYDKFDVYDPEQGYTYLYDKCTVLQLIKESLELGCKIVHSGKLSIRLERIK